MKVLITGVAGFIGPHIVEACLGRGWEVWGVDTKDYTYSTPKFLFEKKDIRDFTEEDLKGVDYVFHLAFVTNIPNSVEHPLDTTRDNIDMTAYVLDISAKAGVKKFVFPSTASLYGNNPTPWKEDMPLDPIEPYSWQKLAGEYACRMWTKRYGLPTVTFRLFQVFGENQRKDTAFAAFFRAKKEGKSITLTETTAQSTFRSGQRDFIYVKEVADAFIRAAESPNTGRGEVFNIGSGKVHTMEEVTEAIGGQVEWIPKRGYEVERHEADISKTEKILDWHPRVDVISWLKEFSKTL